MRWALLLSSLLMLSAAAAVTADVAAAAAERRVALVIGNGAYQNVARLKNPANDAQLMAETLAAIGFELVGGKPLIDADKAGLERAIRSFGQALRGGAIGLFYYSGHGVQIGGINYLIPVGANVAEELDAKFELVDAGLVLDAMANARNRLNIMILDACRNNPFGGRGLRDIGAGLAQVSAPAGTVISYATQPGDVAQDGAGRHSPYTDALAAAIRHPGQDIFATFNEVGLSVKEATRGQQQPWLATSPIEGRFYFVPGESEEMKRARLEAEQLKAQAEAARADAAAARAQAQSDAAARAQAEAQAKTDAAQLAKAQAEAAAAMTAAAAAARKQMEAEAEVARARAEAATMQQAAAADRAAQKAAAEAEAKAGEQAAAMKRQSEAEAMRAKAETAAAQAQADAARADTQAEAAVKAQAAAEAAKAAAEAALARSTAAAGGPTQVAVAAAPLGLVSPDRRSADPRRFDGVWTGAETCSSEKGASGFRRPFVAVVKDAHLTIRQGTTGQPGSNVIEGDIDGDGGLKARQTGLTGNPAFNLDGAPAGVPWDARLVGRLGATDGGAERVEGRRCRLTFERQQGAQ
jgi:uncharacterized caspase-like protein